ncbi:MAG: RES family NAD+ phosphorylase [Verrucomicrobiae bacterium]|nr:RES family NAD+ phosphorylase [Verrucomicrobiae bacterium]
MSVTAFRLTKTKHVSTAFDGEGARLYGGRWNSIGTRMVYVAGSRSLATLEILVHVEDISTIEGQYSIIQVSFANEHVKRIDESDLPDGWSSPEPLAFTQMFGDEWIKKNESVILSVPSAVTNEERNFLINPAHPEFSALSIGTAVPYRFDSRLV